MTPTKTNDKRAGPRMDLTVPKVVKRLTYEVSRLKESRGLIPLGSLGTEEVRHR